ncbi:dehydrogenase [Aspergillus oryzae 100-8]|uniref:Dehydrogenase with different specificitie n=1 Tax=Aspergillus oryzae (strain 3.042) TaxID=1160506 RepID=I7ZXJ0_ASPO3|nr:dehydrogenase with different specificitie [Aspergillus oryzae 3.042]KDE85533.1 dehydrogenase [Aspergillus oryzae 100-8]|eukprot:EIT76944.1 dehydrogenase with different specificitie [Aspergillus oryzae 3.042]
MSRLVNNIAIVTGSSSGIRRAIALKFSREGAVVVCADIREIARTEILTETEIATHDLITQNGGTAVMINNAGVSAEADNPRPIWDFSQEIWDKDIALNSTGVFLGCKYASAQMIQQDHVPCGDRDWIVNIISVFGLTGAASIAGYVASKHATMGVTKVAAWDCAPHRIHVNAICPGYKVLLLVHIITLLDTDTAFISGISGEGRGFVQQLHPFRGLGKPEDVANAAIFLASEENTWVTGIGLPVKGGYTSL